ncbi:MAG: M10 family metallopeptidase C-terminal domain-containing protein [Hyphomicrobiaceae bacterium]|nr:M10 family metallopeptidase C-terminal domain-containing protein [Hyphomicrobiaceae bacterium]
MPNVIETTDAAAGTGTIYSLAVGEFAQGNVSALGDSDWYSIQLVAGQQYTFAATGIGISTTNLSDPYLYLRNSSGALVTDDDDDGPGRNSSITFTATATGTYYLDVQAWANTETGLYGLSATTGSRASYDVDMGAGVLLRPEASWSTPGTAATITYGFRATNPNDPEAPNFSQLTAQQQAAVNSALQMYMEIANVTFSLVNSGGYTDNATMLFGNYFSTTDGAGAYAYYPGSTASTDDAGDVWLNLDSVSTTNLSAGTYSWTTLLHEIGHAMGFAHPGDYNAGPGVTITYSNSAQFIQDSDQYTLMSYFDESNTGASFNGNPHTLMLYDIFALQQLYGANMSTRTGDSVYGFNSNVGGLYAFSTSSAPAIAIWDAGGNDTIDASGYSSNQLIDLNDGAFSNIGGLTSNLAIAQNAIIENATGGSGSDTLRGNEYGNTLIGNDGDDVIYGGDGNDILRGGGGRDQLFGGEGNDTIYADSSDDLANIQGGGGTDTLVYSGASMPFDFDLAAHGFEALTLDSSNVSTAQWTQLLNSHIASGGISFSTTPLSGGGRRDIAWDVTQTQIYAFAEDDYNAAGQRVQLRTYYDDGTRRTTGYDLDGSQTYSSYEEDYSVDGFRTQLRTYYDDGTRRTTGYDTTGLTWRSYEEDYNAAGQRVALRTYNDDGTRRTTYWDPAGASNWSLIEEYFDASGNRTRQISDYDDGDANRARLDTSWDVGNAHAWAYQTTQYNSSGAVVRVYGQNDDGSTFG